MAPSIFAEKDFSRIMNDVNGYSHVFMDRIRECHWYDLVYDNSESDAYYCPNLVKIFYTCINTFTIDHDHNQFIVNFDTGDFLVSIDTIKRSHKSQIHHNTPNPFPLLITWQSWVLGV